MPSPISTYTERRRLRLLDPTVRPLWSQRRVFLLATVIGFALGLGVLNGLWTLRSTTANCHRIALLETQIQQTELRALKLLGRPGGAGYQYYLAHPGELRVARAQIEQAIHDFAPPQCSVTL